MMKQTKVAQDQVQCANLTREEHLHRLNHVIMHPHLMATEQALDEAIQEPGDALLIFVCGPAGVGKTTLKNHILQHGWERAPILNLLARPPLHGPFRWREFLLSGISALEQPMFDYKGTFDNDEEKTQLAQPGEAWSASRPLKRINDDDLRMSLETAMMHRRPAAIIIDDAQYLGKVSGERQLQNQLDCLKSLAEATDTMWVLIGNYDLLRLYHVSTQAIGRSFLIHFPRYQSTAEELFQFKGVLRTFQEFFPFEEATDILLKHWEFCYERSLGCVGILHSMLRRAVHAALWANEKTFSEKYLSRYAPTEAECSAMTREVYEGEREMASRPASTELRQMLGLAPHALFSHEASATKRQSVSWVKERKPKRDRE
jgi:hypothetical protein